MIHVRTSIIGGAAIVAAVMSGCCMHHASTQPAGSDMKATAKTPAHTAQPAPQPVPAIQPAMTAGATVYVTEFKPGDNAAKFISSQTEGGQAKIVTEGGKSSLQFEGPASENGFVVLGAPVSGEFAIEVTVRAVSDPHDLSIFLDGVGQGPAFQFAADDNTANRLWSDAALAMPSDPDRPATVTIENKPMAVKGKWHQVRLEIRAGKAAGYVDGQKYGEVKLSSGYDLKRPRQPLMYTYGGTIEIQRVVVQQIK